MKNTNVKIMLMIIILLFKIKETAEEAEFIRDTKELREGSDIIIPLCIILEIIDVKFKNYFHGISK